MKKITEVERGNYFKIDISDWLKTQEGRDLFLSCPRMGIPTTHIPGKKLSKNSQIILPFGDENSRYRSCFTDYMWYTICARAGKHQFHHGLLWLTNDEG